MLTRRHLLAAGGAACCALSIGGRASAASAATVTFGPATPVYALNVVALEKGFFKDDGVDLKIIPVDAGSRGRQMLAAGEAMFAHGDASHPLQLSNRGKKSKMILATQMVASTASIVVRKDLFEQGITTPEILASGKRPDGSKPVVSATAIGSGTWLFGSYLFESKNLAKNINWVAGGGTTTTLAGLQSKQFDAIMAPPAWQLEAESKGFGKTIYDVRTPGVWQRDFGGNIPVLVVYALADTIDSNPELIQSYVNALYRALVWMKSAPLDEMIDLVGKKYFSAVSPEATKIEMVFDRDTWAYDGRIAKQDFERGGPIWFRPETQIAPTSYEDIVEMRFLDAAQKRYG